MITPQITPLVSRDLVELPALPVKSVDWAALLDDPMSAAFCLRAARDIVGVGAGRIGSERRGEVLAVYVAPEWRRRYWGSKLVDALCACLEERGAQSMQATVETGDRVAEAFWASQGWRPAVRVFRRSFAPPRQRRLRDVLTRRRRGEAGR